MRHLRRILLLLGPLIVALAGARADAQVPPGEETKLQAPQGMSFDDFGGAVALDGDTAVVGASADDTQGANAGAVYVFLRREKTWILQAKLLAADGASGDYFGTAVAISGGTILIGAPYDSNQGRFLAGSAYVFVKNADGIWAQQAKLASGDLQDLDAFGSWVAIVGDTALVGASGDDVNKGSAYVFTRTGSTWAERAKLQPSNLAAGARFGSSGSQSGSTVLIGAPSDTVDSVPTGAVHVFVGGGGTWTPEARLAANDGQRLDSFGDAVTVAGDTALIGALYGDSAAGTRVGAAYVFERDAGSWTETAKLVASDGEDLDYFGTSVALAGATALIGASGDDNQNGASAGAVYAFEESGGTWTEEGKILASDGSEGDGFGFSLSRGQAMLVGAPLGNGNEPSSGVAYIYELDTLDLSTAGTCPGPVTVTITKAPPDSEVAVIAAATNAGWTKGGALCSGTAFEIGEPFQLPPLFVKTDATGSGVGEITLHENRCWLEALAFQSCSTSGAVQVP